MYCTISSFKSSVESVNEKYDWCWLDFWRIEQQCSLLEWLYIYIYIYTQWKIKPWVHKNNIKILHEHNINIYLTITIIPLREEYNY
jgi:hypothetical protein